MVEVHVMGPVMLYYQVRYMLHPDRSPGCLITNPKHQRHNPNFTIMMNAHCIHHTCLLKVRVWQCIKRQVGEEAELYWRSLICDHGQYTPCTN